jgi:hypothetical protein
LNITFSEGGMGMKYGKRLLAVMMVLVMVLTIVPLTMFAFALDGSGTSESPYQIKTYAELKALLEGLGGDGYPADAYYRLENDIDPLHDWVFATAANQLKAAEVLGMSPVETSATYRAATPEDIADLAEADECFQGFVINPHSQNFNMDRNGDF